MSGENGGIELITQLDQPSKIPEPEVGDDALLDIVYRTRARDKERALHDLEKCLSNGNHPCDINQLYTTPDGEVFNLLNYACRKGNAEIVQLLVDKGVSCKACHNDSPLVTAIDFGYIEASKILIENGAPVDSELFARVIKEGFEELAEAMYLKHGMELLRSTTKEFKRSNLSCVDEQNTPFRDLIRYMPDLAKKVLDDCAVMGAYTDNHYSENFSVGYNYEFLDDFQDVALTTGVSSGDGNEANANSGNSGGQTGARYDFKYVTDKSRRNNWGPRKFTKHNHPLSIMVRHKREELLNHPVVASLIHYKWRIYGTLSYTLNLLFYVLFLAALTSFALVVQNPQNFPCLPMSAENATICPDTSVSEGTRVFLRLAAVIVLVISIIKYILEIVQLFTKRVYYFQDASNWFEQVLFPCSLLFTAMPNWACPCVFDWQWQVGAVALCLAWLDFILFTSSFPYVGIYVLMFVEICKTFLKLSLLTLLLVVAFGLTFYMIFSDPRVSRSTFGTGFRSLVRTFVMTTGELDYDGIFRLDASDPDNDGPELAYVYTAYALWIPFVIIMPVLFANLLTGLAVGDTDKIQQEAEFLLIAQKVDQVLTIEEWGRPFRSNRNTRNKKRSKVVRPNKKRPSKWEKTARYVKFLGWNRPYDTFEAVEEVLNKQMDEMAQMRKDIQNLTNEVKKLSEKDNTTREESETPLPILPTSTTV